MTITDPSIVTGDVVYAITSNGITLVGTATEAGSITLTFETDPIFLATAKTPQAPLLLTTTSGRVGTALTLETSGGSGIGAVSYSVSNGTADGCQLSGNVLRASTPGTCVVTASRAGDNTYAPTSSSATEVAWALPSRPAPVTVSFATTVSALSPSAKRSLLALAKKLIAGATVTVLGHATGNQALAMERARIAAHFLQQHCSVHVTIKSSSASMNSVTVTTNRQ
jgi:outer membrane protein OmpA-like peptidoglycan-associated protein